jgi:predicted metal-binding protein
MVKVTSYIQKAVSMGATRAKIIDAKTVVVANWVRLKCQYGCSGYGKRLTCPPYSPTPEYIRAMLAEYGRGLLIQMDNITPAGESRASRKLKRIVADLEREIFLDGYYKAFGMASGPCRFCKHCDPSQPCKDPYQARPAMEACGIDVYRTARNNGFALEVVRSEDEPCSYLSLILID